VPPSDLDDGNSSPYYSDSSIDSSTLGGAQRTVPLVSGSSDARMLAVSTHKRQGAWAVSYRRGSQRKWRWAFLGLRFIRFSDGESLVGFSSGCPCPSSESSLLRAQLACCDRPANPDTWLPAERMCSGCCTQLLASQGGEAAVNRLIRISTPPDTGSVVK
jgi:hypothetical protein